MKILNCLKGLRLYSLKLPFLTTNFFSTITIRNKVVVNLFHNVTIWIINEDFETTEEFASKKLL